MRVEALLCDAATVREGLLHILGGGVTRLNRPSEPAPMDVQMALMLTLQPVETREGHRLKVVVQGMDGATIAETVGEFGVGDVSKLPPGEPIAIPMVLDLRQVLIPKFGGYSVEILVDSQLVKSLPFAMGNMKMNGPP